MNISVIALKSRSTRFFAQCPVTEQRVAVRDSQDFELINQHAMWWRCTECGGWHVALEHAPLKSEPSPG